MGYRSDVTALFYADKSKGAAVRLYVDENFPDDLKGNLTPIENDMYMGYRFDDTAVKWYDSFPEVVAFNKFVANFLVLADQEQIQWAYEFVRVGENTDDVEEGNSDYADYQLRVNRVIESDFNEGVRDE